VGTELRPARAKTLAVWRPAGPNQGPTASAARVALEAIGLLQILEGLDFSEAEAWHVHVGSAAAGVVRRGSLLTDPQGLGTRGLGWLNATGLWRS
jgi:hypothetical protein